MLLIRINTNIIAGTTVENKGKLILTNKNNSTACKRTKQTNKQTILWIHNICLYFNFELE